MENKRVSPYVMPGLKYRHNQVFVYDTSNVISVICEYLNTSKSEIRSEIRTTNVSYKRAIICYILYFRCRLTLPQIAKEIGKHHTSVLQALRRIRTDLEMNRSEYKKDIEEISKLIRSSQND